MNTALHAKATNDFEKDFFELMINSCYGKMMENIEGRVDVRLVTDEKKALELAAPPTCERRTIFKWNLTAVHKRQSLCVINLYILVGAFSA